MISILLAFAELVFIVWLLHAIERRGEKRGYAKGYEEGRKSADNWWMNLEYEVRRNVRRSRTRRGGREADRGAAAFGGDQSPERIAESVPRRSRQVCAARIPRSRASV